ncbi:MAG: (2Fe-2S)-binding protein [Proteobacteria bacterium]|nr:(2Fe-2S)-binding protein [Pseudomonadota bacterium]
MIVCVCNNVSDRKIRQAVADGVTTMSELRTELGVAACCGKCHSCAKQVLRDALEESAQTQSVMFFGALPA